MKFNESLAFNKNLRERIDTLRRERVVFDSIYKKLERELHEKKKVGTAEGWSDMGAGTENFRFGAEQGRCTIVYAHCQQPLFGTWLNLTKSSDHLETSRVEYNAQHIL